MQGQLRNNAFALGFRPGAGHVILSAHAICQPRFSTSGTCFAFDTFTRKTQPPFDLTVEAVICTNMHKGTRKITSCAGTAFHQLQGKGRSGKCIPEPKQGAGRDSGF